jgi:hypothetical protein
MNLWGSLSGQPLPDGGHDPARSQMKFQPRLHGFLPIQAFATQSMSELCGFHNEPSQFVEQLRASFQIDAGPTPS